MTLYELTAEYLLLLQMAEDPETDPQAFTDTMEAIKGDIHEKADGYGRVFLELNARKAVIKKEVSRLLAMSSAIEGNLERMKAVFTDAMQVTGQKKIKTDLFTFWLQKSPEAVKIDDESKIPEQYLIAQEPKIDRAGIKDALKKGEKFGWAHLEQTESLRMR